MGREEDIQGYLLLSADSKVCLQDRALGLRGTMAPGGLVLLSVVAGELRVWESGPA